MNRDINAAINILKRALQNRDGQSRWELTWAVAPCVSQEATALQCVWSVTNTPNFTKLHVVLIGL